MMREHQVSTELIFPALLAAGAIHVAMIFGVRVDLPKPVFMRGALEVALMPGVSDEAVVPREKPLENGDASFRPVEQQPRVPLVAKSAAASPMVPSSTSVSSPGAPVPRTEHRAAGIGKPNKRGQEAQPGGAVARDAVVETGEPTRLTAATLGRQITEWSDEYNQAQKREFVQAPRTAYVEKVASHRIAAAAYERTWQDKVERVGNMNYPEEARRKNLTGGLMLSVGVNADGSIQTIQVRKSSGHQELDQAAIRIVRLAAPFSSFPSELKKDYDVLLITRTWRFFIDNHLATSP